MQSCPALGLNLILHNIRVTTRYYTKAVKRRAKLSGEYLAEFDRVLAWAALPGSEKAETVRILSGRPQESPGVSSNLA
jgi:hypothetical protein